MTSNYSEWCDPYTPKTLDLAEDVIDELASACRLMLKAAGGSRYWNGETAKALAAIEYALDEDGGEVLLDDAS